MCVGGGVHGDPSPMVSMVWEGRRPCVAPWRMPASGELGRVAGGCGGLLGVGVQYGGGVMHPSPGSDGYLCGSGGFSCVWQRAELVTMTTSSRTAAVLLPATAQKRGARQGRNAESGLRIGAMVGRAYLRVVCSPAGAGTLPSSRSQISWRRGGVYTGADGFCLLSGRVAGYRAVWARSRRRREVGASPNRRTPGKRSGGTQTSNRGFQNIIKTI